MVVSDIMNFSFFWAEASIQFVVLPKREALDTKVSRA